MQKVELPDKLSELIRVAVKDLEACRADPAYVIDMFDWHLPRGGVCHVCLAGAVFAKTCGAPPDHPSCMEDFDLEKLGIADEKNAGAMSDKFSALNAARGKGLVIALMYMGHDEEVRLEPFEWGEYDMDDPDGETLLRLADHLERQGY
jgi:hypothetical protein